MNDGGPAFPSDFEPGGVPGMTLRQWYAGMAIQGFCNHQIPADWLEQIKNETDALRYNDSFVRTAFALADAMLKYEE
jgi:hypothetical protein